MVCEQHMHGGTRMTRNHLCNSKDHLARMIGALGRWCFAYVYETAAAVPFVVPANHYRPPCW
jgi:hypothetical protein